MKTFLQTYHRHCHLSVGSISAVQLSQYANGYRNPSPKTTAKIQDALHSFGKELSQLQLV